MHTRKAYFSEVAKEVISSKNSKQNLGNITFIWDDVVDKNSISSTELETKLGAS